MNNLSYSWIDGELQTKLFIQNNVVDLDLSFRNSLFNTPRHLGSQSSGPYFSFYLFKNKETNAIAVVHIIEASDRHFQSPARAPFGGIQCLDQCSLLELSFFISCVVQGLSKHQANQINIRVQPSCYNNDKHILLHKAYMSTGFKILSEEINTHIAISDVPFDKLINRFERKRLSVCKIAGFKVEKTGSKQTVESIYRFIQQSYSEKNYSLSITQKQFEILFKQFPDACHVFQVKDDRKVISLCVSILVTEKILYLFLPADLLCYRKFSPMVLLYEAIYNYAKTENIEILDLGTSLDNHGYEKPDLLRFKKNLGGTESLKITYHKQL